MVTTSAALDAVNRLLKEDAQVDAQNAELKVQIQEAMGLLDDAFENMEHERLA